MTFTLLAHMRDHFLFLSNPASQNIPHSTSAPLVLGCNGQSLVLHFPVQQKQTVESVAQHYAPEQMFSGVGAGFAARLVSSPHAVHSRV